MIFSEAFFVAAFAHMMWILERSLSESALDRRHSVSCHLYVCLSKTLQGSKSEATLYTVAVRFVTHELRQTPLQLGVPNSRFVHYLLAARPFNHHHLTHHQRVFGHTFTKLPVFINESCIKLDQIGKKNQKCQKYVSLQRELYNASNSGYSVLHRSDGVEYRQVLNVFQSTRTVVVIVDDERGMNFVC